MKDQRQFVRKSLHCMVSVFSNEGKPMGSMVDYSDSGIMVVSYQPIESDQTYDITIVDLPNNIGRKRTGKVTVKSVWSDKVSQTMFGTGFLLIEQDEQAKTMFASYDEANINL
ncbi:hypothetical protein NBRC116188_19170 [Oceaniserpentilla sp. 4NH20-0058]|uniref:PilZ domain-containing protein n=1 Tax=Oceaniserpentilla sp. 4NH20-0058 TaxID=3127660 RepID=UPI00310B41A8